MISEGCDIEDRSNDAEHLVMCRYLIAHWAASFKW